jgi:hypothetical protein
LEVLRWLRPKTNGGERTVAKAGPEMIGVAGEETTIMTRATIMITTITITITTTITILTTRRLVTVVGRRS